MIVSVKPDVAMIKTDSVKDVAVMNAMNKCLYDEDSNSILKAGCRCKQCYCSSEAGRRYD